MRKGILFGVLTAALFVPASASAGTYFSGTPFGFPEFNPGPNTAYSHTIAVAGEQGKVTKVQANLNGFSANNPAGGQALLVGPQGQKTILLNEACGGTAVSGLTFNFIDSALGTLPNNCVGQSGPFKPTDNGPADSMPGPAPAAPYPVTLSVFNGTVANGTWTLFVRDRLIGGDSPVLSAGWSLQIDSTLDGVANTNKKKCKKKKHRSAESAKKKKCKKRKKR
jgi:hypothetical protein